MIFQLWLVKGHWFTGDRAVLYTASTPSAKVYIYASSPFFDLYLEISGRALHGLQISVSDKFYVQVPADLDQFGGDNSHGTIIGGKGLIQLGHGPSYGRGFFKEVDIVSRVC
jgi:hypothetical protein